jgi:hypothetical protein
MTKDSFKFRFGEDWDSPLPGQTFKSVHNISPEEADASEDQRACDSRDERDKAKR